MNYFGRIVSGIKDYYSEINSATLTGAIDTIVVRQADGSFIGSPFHVRFGKIGVLRSREKVVDISINDEPVDLHMKLGEAGEAFFVEPCEEYVPDYLCTSPIPDTEKLMSEGIKKMKQEIKESSSYDSRPGSSASNNEKDIIIKRDSDNESTENDASIDDNASYFVKRSENISVPGNKSDSFAHTHQHLNQFYPLSDMDSPIVSPDQQSPIGSQHDLPRYLSDSEVNYQYDLDNMKENEEMTWNWGRLPQGLDTSTKRKAIPSEQRKESQKPKVKSSSHEIVSQGMYLEDLHLVDQEVANLYLHQAGGMESPKSEVDGKNSMENITSDHEITKDNVEMIKSDNEVNKSDGESGLGSSLSVSPDETKMQLSEPYSTIALSLCGDVKKNKVSLERFMESLVDFETFSENPAKILSNQNLVVRIDDRYYNWNVAVPMLMSHVVYQRPLPKNSVDALVKEHMPKKSKRRGYSWFSWRSQPEHNESTDEETEQHTQWNKDNIVNHDDDTLDKLDGTVSPEPLLEIPEADSEIDQTMTTPENFKKVLELSSEQLASLNLKDGANDISFSVTTKYQGTATCSASIFLYNHDDKIIISDIDGTITKSDVLGQILPASFWAQSGVAKLFSSIQKNGYKFIYLSARSIGTAEITRQHLKNVVQENLCLPNGPLFLTPSSLIKAFHREVIEKRPQDFKIPCLRNIRKLFPMKCSPFYAGFGNRSNDVLSYRAVGIPIQRIFTVNHKGEVRNELTNAFQSSYTEMQDVVDQMFAPLLGSTSFVASDEYSTFTYWRTPVSHVVDIDQSEGDISKADKTS